MLRRNYCKSGTLLTYLDLAYTRRRRSKQPAREHSVLSRKPHILPSLAYKTRLEEYVSVGCRLIRTCPLSLSWKFRRLLRDWSLRQRFRRFPRSWRSRRLQLLGTLRRRRRQRNR